MVRVRATRVLEALKRLAFNWNNYEYTENEEKMKLFDDWETINIVSLSAEAQIKKLDRSLWFHWP